MFGSYGASDGINQQFSTHRKSFASFPVCGTANNCYIGRHNNYIINKAMSTIIRRKVFHHDNVVNIDNELKELGLRQLYDAESKSFSYLIWDKETEEAVLIDPVRNQVSRDVIVCTNLKLMYAINTHVHEDHISGAALLKKKIKGLKSVISKASGADADEYIEDGDEIHFGKRHIVAIATPGHTSGCMSFLLDDGKAVITGDTLSLGGVDYNIVQECGGSVWSLCDSIFHKLFHLPDSCVVLPGHDNGTGTHSTIEKVRNELSALCGNTTEDFVDFMDCPSRTPAQVPPKKNICIACNKKDGVEPFYVRCLRDKIKNRWGVFG